MDRRRDILAQHESEMLRALGQHQEIRPFIGRRAALDFDALRSRGDGAAARAVRRAWEDQDVISLTTGKAHMQGLYIGDLQTLRARSDSVLGILRSIRGQSADQR
jgi:hypothetical protein